MAESPKQVAPLAKPGEIAQLLSVSEKTVRRLAASGVLPAYRVGSSFRFDRSEVIASTRRRR
jgi:excisionase family DNA binding protein